jgi:prophage regulatory protein
LSRILRRELVTEKTGLERSAIYQRMALGTFPKQVRLGPQSVGRLESKIDSWIEQRVAARETEPVSDGVARREAARKAGKASAAARRERVDALKAALLEKYASSNGKN